MPADNKSTDSFLAAIEAKVAAWKAVADSYRAAVSIDGPLGDVTVPLRGVAATASTGSLQPHQLPVGVFRDKSLKEAIPIYLAAVRRTQTNKEIAIGLQAGGFPTTADNFEATVATALYRLRLDGTVLRFPDGWDLAASYPDNLRGRLVKDAAPKKAKKAARARSNGGKAASRVEKASAHAKPMRPKAAPAATPESIDSRVAAYLKAHTGEGFLPKTVREALNETDPKTVGLAFARLARHGKVMKDENGLYRSA